MSIDVLIWVAVWSLVLLSMKPWRALWTRKN